MHQVATPLRGGTSIVVGRDRLTWRGDVLHLGGGRALLSVVADPTWPGMWRVKHRDGRVSDMVNLTRVRDAATSIASAILSECEAQATPREARRCVETVGGARG